MKPFLVSLRCFRSVGWRAVLALVATLSLGACETVKHAGGALFSSGDDKPQSPGFEAPLRPLAGTAVQGSVRFTPRGTGVAMLIELHGAPATQYRVMVHANGNCTSPNGFSAGPPWSPAGANPPLPARARPVTTNSEGTATLTIRLADVASQGPNGVEGRSVVVHEGATGSLDAKPDLPNDRVACGVIGALRSLF